jgi:hypothetical protein
MARVASGACQIDAVFPHGNRMRTMLIIAVIRGDTKHMRLLLRANANPNFVTTGGESALIAAVQTWGSSPDKLQIILWTLENETARSFSVNWDVRTVGNMNAIHIAQSMNMASAIVLLISYGVPSQSSTAVGMTTGFYGRALDSVRGPCTEVIT